MSAKMLRPAVLVQRVERRILLIRGHKVMLDADLAVLYGVATKTLNRAVRRNRDRFPVDFMFELTSDEAAALRYQSGTSNAGRGGRRYLPYAFTEQGVAMLSSVLRSQRAIQVNIAKYDKRFRVVFAAIRHLMASAELPRRRIGF